ncbi:DNA-binding transcriptional regulator LsrR (DeoR family) [Amaricoccus macauensis]|uniref:DNA-binding transcriptional regulator LsrR (DeoR family) n=1 Tax=Amaricoccus macauensis TaxID=57001 RepID=A0A840SQ94_9RHOB|nr:sugar-binding domain-containing protein [Amaricoccus macauensis]MBB5222920.1 DNA-binding transcriptional regulator LsrR (DeoR family) [Amaricoccus macauensis]
MLEMSAEGHESQMLMARAAWLYYVAGFNQEAAAKRLGITRARINKLLADARESGLVSIQINQAYVGLLPVEEELRSRYGLDFCVCTPELGQTDAGDQGEAAEEFLRGYAFRAVGMAAAAHLKRHLQANRTAVIGTGWGRTLEQMTLNSTGISAPDARFISLMGSLTANSAYNPFEVVHALARATGGEGHFLPVPFIADSAADRQVLLAQRSVQQALVLAREATVAYISIGELTETSLLRRQEMISADQLVSLRAAGAVGDTNGLFFDAAGSPVDHELNSRTIALGFDDLRQTNVIALVAGVAKQHAADAFLRSGVARGLVIDGDTALRILGK